MSKTRLLTRLRQHLARTHWMEQAISALYLVFAVQEVGQRNTSATLVTVAISALFLVTPFSVFNRRPLLVQLGLVAFGCWLLVMFLKLD